MTTDHALLNEFDLLLLDIEGTTTPIDFVHEELFPYARRALKGFLERHGEEEAVRGDIARLGEDVAGDPDAPRLAPEGDGAARRRSAEAIALWQMNRDRKTQGLKSLQGKIWRAGYERGELKAPIYDDALRLMRRVHQEQGRRLAIYSSGSVEAQRLLFGHSEHGDLRPLIEAYFDTTTGPKKKPESYARIARSLGLTPARVLFLTDNLDEARAAREAGCGAALSVRPGNPELEPGHRFLELSDFDTVATTR